MKLLLEVEINLDDVKAALALHAPTSVEITLDVVKRHLESHLDAYLEELEEDLELHRRG